MSNLLAVITATDKEEEAVRKLLPEIREEQGPAGLTFALGELNGRPCVAVRAGIGKVNAALCTQALIDRYRPAAVINVGVAGALDPTLRIADVVIAECAVQHDIDTAFFGDPLGTVPGLGTVEIPADETVAAALREACGKAGVSCKVGKVLSGDQFICAAGKKQWLVGQFGGSCTEMEGASIAQVCALNGVPFGILRGISDGAGDEAGMQYEEFAAMSADRAARILAELGPVFAEEVSE